MNPTPTQNRAVARQELIARDVAQSDTLMSRVLAAIRATDGIGEGELMQKLFPRPAFPAVGERTPEAIEAWRKADYDYSSRAYYRQGVVEYRDCYSALISSCTIALQKAGLIRTDNNGFNCYTYFPVNRKS